MSVPLLQRVIGGDPAVVMMSFGCEGSKATSHIHELRSGMQSLQKHLKKPSMRGS